MKYSRFKTILLLISILFVTCEPRSELQLELELQKHNFLVWNFPLPGTHTGALIGNGVQGLMVWGIDNQLNVTIGRAGFWDRRGGKDFLKNTTFKEVKNLLYSKNEKGLRKTFGMDVEAEPGQPERPHQIGGGRLEIELPEGWNLKKGVLDLNYGIFEISVRGPNDQLEVIRLRQSVYDEMAALTFSKHLNDKIKVKLIPSW